MECSEFKNRKKMTYEDGAKRLEENEGEKE